MSDNHTRVPGEPFVVEGHALAPFTDDQVTSLNGYQQAGLFHPFTCGNDSSHELLVATAAGWQCPSCDYRQNWAHDWMADNGWQEVLRRRQEEPRDHEG